MQHSSMVALCTPVLRRGVSAGLSVEVSVVILSVSSGGVGYYRSSHGEERIEIDFQVHCSTLVVVVIPMSRWKNYERIEGRFR